MSYNYIITSDSFLNVNPKYFGVKMVYFCFVQLIGLEECARRIDALVKDAKQKAGINVDTPLQALVSYL